MSSSCCARRAAFDWTKVQPSIFGSLLEGGFGREKQWALGAHYTHEADIQKVVEPTIVEPGATDRALVGTRGGQAPERPAELRGARSGLRLGQLPLRRLPRAAPDREATCGSASTELRAEAGLPDQVGLSAFFPLRTCAGSRSTVRVALARVTLWMGHKLAVDELGLDETHPAARDLSGHRAWRRAAARVAAGRRHHRQPALPRRPEPARRARRRVRRVADRALRDRRQGLLRLLVPEGRTTSFEPAIVLALSAPTRSARTGRGA